MMTTLLERHTTYHASMLAQQHVSSPIEWGEILAPVRTLIQQAGDIGELLDLKALALLQRHLIQEAQGGCCDTYRTMVSHCTNHRTLLIVRRAPASRC